MLPLTFVKTGDIVRVVRVQGNDAVKKHLNELGFVNDTIVNVISSHNGDVILNVKNSRLAITKAMADKIMVDIASEKELLKEQIN